MSLQLKSNEGQRQNLENVDNCKIEMVKFVDFDWIWEIGFWSLGLGYEVFGIYCWVIEILKD